MKRYESTKQGKADFVREVLSPLVYQADTGWRGAEYEADEHGEEYVYLLTVYGAEIGRGKRILVTGDSVQAIVSDVFNNL